MIRAVYLANSRDDEPLGTLGHATIAAALNDDP